MSRRTVTMTWHGERFTFVFGPLWYRWLLLLCTRGRAHVSGSGEPCVLYRSASGEVPPARVMRGVT